MVALQRTQCKSMQIWNSAKRCRAQRGYCVNAKVAASCFWYLREITLQASFMKLPNSCNRLWIAYHIVNLIYPMKCENRLSLSTHS